MGCGRPNSRRSLVEAAGAQVRAVLPGPVAELDKRIAKLQVGGTDAPVDAARPDLPPPVLQVWIPPEPVMTLGKTMAQAGHAGMIAAALLAGGDLAGLAGWAAAGCPAQVQRVDAGVWASLLAATADPGRGLGRAGCSWSATPASPRSPPAPSPSSPARPDLTTDSSRPRLIGVTRLARALTAAQPTPGCEDQLAGRGSSRRQASLQCQNRGFDPRRVAARVSSGRAGSTSR